MSEKLANITPEKQGFAEKIPRELARKIFEQKETAKSNFWGLEEWKEFYDIRLSAEQLEKVKDFPWGEDVLTAPDPFTPKNEQGEPLEIRDTHVAVLMLDKIDGDITRMVNGKTEALSVFNEPLTIMELSKINPYYEGDLRSGEPKFSQADPSQSFRGENFSKEVAPSFRWYLMRKEGAMTPPQDNKGRLNFNEWYDQLALLSHVSAKKIREQYEDICERVDFKKFKNQEEEMDFYRLEEKKFLEELLKNSEYEIAAAVEEAAKMMLFFKKDDLLFNQDAPVRCKDTTVLVAASIAGRVSLTNRKNGLLIQDYTENTGGNGYGMMRLAVSRKISR